MTKIKTTKFFSDKIKLFIEDIKKYNPEKVIVFGSCLTKNADEYSDIDAVVIKKTKEKFFDRFDSIRKFIRDDLQPVDIFVYTPQEFQKMIDTQNPFIEQVLKTGKVVYEKQ